MTIIGEMKDKIWYQSLAVIAFCTLTTLIAQRFLCVKLFTLFQFQIFQQLLEFQFAKVALHLHFTCQGTCQSIGRFTNGSTLLHINLDGLVQSCQSLRLLFLGLVESFLHVFQTALQGVDNLRHLLLILGTQLLLTHLQHLLRSRLHLFLNQVQLTFHLLVVHLLQGSNLLLMGFLGLLQLMSKIILGLLQLMDKIILGLFQLQGMGILHFVHLTGIILCLGPFHIALGRQPHNHIHQKSYDNKGYHKSYTK